MSRDRVFITPRKHSATDLIGKRIEVDVVERKSNRAIQTVRGIGQIRVEPHPKTSGRVCIWVMLNDGTDEWAMDDIDEDHLEVHPNRSKADYLCKAVYAEGGENHS